MKLVIFGLGYSSQAFVRNHGHAHDITGTVRKAEKAAALAQAGLKISQFGHGEVDETLLAAMAQAEALIVSVPPSLTGDPVLQSLGDVIQSAPNLTNLIYLSTVGVYGDHAGAWVDEDTVPRPVSARSIERLAAEQAWTNFATETGKSLHILRLSGIYGPGRSGFDKLVNGTARRIIKRDQVFNRIHVDDIAQAIEACLHWTGAEVQIWNVTDDEPAPPQDVVSFAASLMGLPLPPEVDFETADLTSMARSFYGENKRVSNAKMKAELRSALLYPTYREGLASIFKMQHASSSF